MTNELRPQERLDFCRNCGLKVTQITELPKDASTRAYFRIQTEEGSSYILMDDEGCRNKMAEFVKIDELLQKFGVHAPKIFGQNMEQGLLLLEDLGNDTLTKLLEKGGPREWYKLATEPLIKIAKMSEKPDYVAELSPERVLQDIDFFVDWYVPLVRGSAFSAEQRAEFNQLVSELIPLGYLVPKTLVLWDYHVDNVMLPLGADECAVLDFQDGLWGPLTYDIMSLVEDARREVAPEVQAEMKDLFFASLSGMKREDFEASFAFWSLFRHLRVLGRFSILMACHRKDKYLRHVPHLWEMLGRTLQHPAFAKIKAWLDVNLPPSNRGIPRLKPITKAMMLAAGRGTRMRELTKNCPKALLQVNGKALMDYNLDKLVGVNIKDVVVNLCHLGEKIKQHLAERKDLKVVYSEEETALETGGGIKKALPLLGDEAFILLNCDTFCTDDGVKPELWRMIDAWDENKFDMLLLLAEIEKVAGDPVNGIGNYRLTQDGLWERNVNKTSGFPYLYTGLAIVHPRVFAKSPDGAFSLRDLFDSLALQGRLGMVVAQSKMFQVGTPEAICAAEIALKSKNNS